MSTINERVRGIIYKYLKDTKINYTDSLFENGVDSMTILMILHDIEIDFNIKIPDEELLISNFQSIEHIAELINRMEGEQFEH